MRELILGDNTFTFYMAWLFFALSGYITIKVITYVRRLTLHKFSIKYYIKDNGKDFIAWLLLAAGFVRFYDQINAYFPIGLPEELDMFSGYVVGFLGMVILQLVRKQDWGSFLTFNP